MFTTDGRLFSNGPNGPHSRVRWTLEMVSCSNSRVVSVGVGVVVVVIVVVVVTVVGEGSSSSCSSCCCCCRSSDDVVMMVMPHL